MRGYSVAVVLILLTRAAGAGELRWETEWTRAFDAARAEARLVFVDFWASWCVPCREMDAKTFPDPSVSERLSDFILLRIDVDRSTVARKHRVTAFPSYVIFDPWERERFRFTGFQEAGALTTKLDRVRAAAPGMVAGGRSLSQSENAEAYLLIGNSYLKAKVPTDAREAFVHARRIADRHGKKQVAQAAEIQTALTWAIEGDSEKALRMLAEIVRSPADSECAASAWLSIGHVHRLRKNGTEATSAYQRALSACPPDSSLRKEAESALAAVRR